MLDATAHAAAGRVYGLGKSAIDNSVTFNIDARYILGPEVDEMLAYSRSWLAVGEAILRAHYTGKASDNYRTAVLEYLESTIHQLAESDPVAADILRGDAASLDSGFADERAALAAA